MALTKTHTFTSGTTAQASQVNTNFDQLFDAIGGQEFTEQNYVTDDEATTASLDALDMQVKDNADAITGGQGYVEVPEQASAQTPGANEIHYSAMEGDGGSESIPVIWRESGGGTLGLLCGDGNHKQWVYKNTATTFWVVDATVTDAVLAIKGGAQAYNANGGTEGGTWTQPNHTHSFSGSGTSGTPSSTEGPGSAGEDVIVASSGHTHSVSISGTAGSGATAATWRPAAAIGTMQYPDMPA